MGIFEPDPIGSETIRKQWEAENFSLTVMQEGQKALHALYPIALARSKKQKSPLGTVEVKTVELLALCHAIGMAFTLLGRVADQALSDAVLKDSAGTAGEEDKDSGAKALKEPWEA
jgi:hypothetical protein